MPNESNSQSSTNTTQCKIKVNVFDTQTKVHINNSPDYNSTHSPGTLSKINVDQKWLGLFKAHCELDENFLSSINITHKPMEDASLKRLAFEFKINGSLDFTTFETIANQDPCVLSISKIDDSDDQLLAATDWIDSDPLASKQSWIEDIRLADSLDEFYHKTYGIKQDIIVADLDTGIRYQHEDFASSSLWKQANGLIGYNVLNPQVDAIDDFETGPGQSSGTAAHGSKVAGIIAATNGNNKGIIGMMPSNIKFMAVKYINNQGAKPADRVTAFNYAVANGAKVINLSIGFSNNEVTFRQMLEDFTNEGGFVATSAGNNGQLLNAQSNVYPAVWGPAIKGMMSVGGTQSGSFNIWPSTNYSSGYVEIAAPAGSVFTTIPWHPGNQVWGNYYGATSGTSFSSPMVAGAAALVMAMLNSNGIAYSSATLEEIIDQGSRINNNLLNQFKDGKTLDMVNLVAEVHRRYPQIKNPVTPDPKPTPDPDPMPPITPGDENTSVPPTSGDNEQSVENSNPPLNICP